MYNINIFMVTISKFTIIRNFFFRYNRQHNLVPGKFSLNIRGIPENIGNNYTQALYSLISDLVVKSEYLPITISNMNRMDMVPR